MNIIEIYNGVYIARASNFLIYTRGPFAVLSIFDFLLILLIHARIYLVGISLARSLSWHYPFD